MSSTEANNILLIVNPISGRGRGLRTSRGVAQLLRAGGCRVDVVETTATGHAEQLAGEFAAKQHRQPSMIVACGGDGCLQEVAGALASAGTQGDQEAPIMGLAPSGRCNDFARALGIAANPIAIAEVLMSGRATDIDLGRINGRCFCTVATVGVDAAVSHYVDTMRLPLKGTPAYLYGAMRVLWRYQAPPIRLEGDFGIIERPLLIASCANTCSYGGAIRIAPQADPADGLLDLCLIESVSRLRLLSLLPRLILGRHESAPEVRFIRTRRVAIESPQPRPIWADGERIGTTPATIEIVPKAIRVMLPRLQPS